MKFNKGDKVLVGNTSLGKAMNEHGVVEEMHEYSGRICTITHVTEWDFIEPTYLIDGDTWEWTSNSFVGKVAPPPMDSGYYHEGDIVFVSSSLKEGYDYHFYVPEEMASYAGKPMRVDGHYMDAVLINGSEWDWHPGMFDHYIAINSEYPGRYDDISFIKPLFSPVRDCITECSRDNTTQRACAYSVGDFVRIGVDKACCGEEYEGLTLFRDMFRKFEETPVQIITTAKCNDSSGGHPHYRVSGSPYWYSEAMLKKVVPFSMDDFRSGKLIVNCRTEQELKDFLAYLTDNAPDLDWRGGDSIGSYIPPFHYHEEETCVAVLSYEAGLGYSPLYFYEEICPDSTILRYSDLFFLPAHPAAEVERFINGEVAVHCETKEEAENFLSMVHEVDPTIEWRGGQPLDDCDDVLRRAYHRYDSDMSIGRENGYVMYGPTSCWDIEVVPAPSVKKKEVDKKVPFDYLNFKNGKVAIHCKMEEEADSFLNYLDTIEGETWCTGRKSSSFTGPRDGVFFSHTVSSKNLGFCHEEEGRAFYREEGVEVVEFDSLTFNEVSKRPRKKFDFQSLLTLFQNGTIAFKVDKEYLVPQLLGLLEDAGIVWGSGHKATEYGMNTEVGCYFVVVGGTLRKGYGAPSVPEINLSDAIDLVE